jgi:hypothetical protein
VLRQLIVNADDFGYTPGVTRGILRAHREGIVTSTSVMINMPAAGESLELAHREAPQLGLGLHLTLTAGPCAAPPHEIPDLVQSDGTFRPKGEFLTGLHTLDMQQVEHELRAQIARFEALAGHKPDHLDSHHHATYLSPPLATLMMQLARELGVPIRRPLPGGPEAVERGAALLLEAIGGMPERAYAEEMVEILGAFMRQSGVAAPDHFIAEFYGERAILGELLLILVAVPEGVTELMCHPAEVDDALRASSSYADRRADELRWLTHPSTREVIRTEFIQLITFADIEKSG